MNETKYNAVPNASLENGSKTLLLIRHAKSDWNDPSLKDFDRALNDRGKKDAPEMAKRLLSKKIDIDAFISSPAKRATKTAEEFMTAYERKKKELIFFEELYLGQPAIFFDVISKTDDNYNSIALFAHNSGITDFANMLTNTRIDNMPTCSIFAVKIEPRINWSEFATAKKEFWFFDYPKAGL